MKRYLQIAPLFVLLVPFVVLIPLGRMAVDYVQLVRLVPDVDVQPSYRGFDWVFWDEEEGNIVARYVLPRGPAGRAGIQQGDQFFSLDGQQYFNVEQLEEAIEGIPPGQEREYVVIPGNSFTGRALDGTEHTVQFTRYPTFLYPLSASLWIFSLWSFTLAAFFHVLGLLIVGPLAFRTRRAHAARFSLLLILASSLWIFGNLSRLYLVQGISPPVITGTLYDRLFRALTLISILGWISFPALLLRKVLGDAHLIGRGRLGKNRLLIYLPMLVYGILVIYASWKGNLGPFTPDNMITPLIIYACCYVALGAGLVFTLYLVDDRIPDAMLGGWSRMGSGLTMVTCVVMLMLIMAQVPLQLITPGAAAGWLIVLAQLLSLGPVILVSLATLRRGKIDVVLTRALAYLTAFGAIFFAFVGGLELLERYVPGFVVSRKIMASLFAVGLLFIFERLARRMRFFAERFFATERQTIRQGISRFQEEITHSVDLADLAQKTIVLLGETYQSRFATIFIRPDQNAVNWISRTYDPRPPYLTERVATRLWPHFKKQGLIWSRNGELNEGEIDPDLGQLLKSRGAMLVVPILTDEKLFGLMVLGPRKRRGSVYNVEDVDLLRGLAGHLGLAIERLILVEREKKLIQASAEAELVALRAQINPHFLFNALNTIISLIEERPEQAEEVVHNLASIFRYTLQNERQLFVSIADELKLVQHYLAIEKERFAERLTVDLSIDPATEMHQIPAFAVQTIVENAIKHGLEKKRNGGTLQIQCRPGADQSVIITVADTGVGIPSLFERGAEHLPEFFGIGLRNVALRMEKIYGLSDLMLMQSNPEAGTTVTLKVPLQPNPGPRVSQIANPNGQEISKVGSPAPSRMNP